MVVLNVILILFFGSFSMSSPVGIAVSLIGGLYILGYWGIFKKCGLPGWQALIPCYRDYALARCAGRENEGRVYFGLSVALTLFSAAAAADDRFMNLSSFNSVISLVVSFGYMIYTIRIVVGLCDVFGRKKSWILVWLVYSVIPSLIFGWNQNYQPQWTVQELEGLASDVFSNSRAEVMEQGLTVNLEDRSVTEMFRKRYLLRDIHMSIKPGSMVLLLGGSGAGKTTLINAINGYEKANAEITLNSADVYGQYKKMIHRIGFVPQGDLMREADTVLHTLLDSAALRLPASMGRARRRERVEEVMNIFGLTPVSGSLVGKLSGGQRKRLSIAMEFISNPDLFILDEPDSGLDGVMARELMQQLRGIADQGKIVIVVTHTPDRVIDLFDSVIVLAKDDHRIGRLAYYGPIDEARTFFNRESMEQIVRSINRREEGGDGLADEFIRKYAEVQHV